jgi:hypothetical protein
MFAAKLKAAGRLASVGEKCPFFDVMIGAIESESDVIGLVGFIVLRLPSNAIPDQLVALLQSSNS